MDQCPTGTIPIKRTTSDDIFQEKLYLNNILTKEIPGKHVRFSFILI